MMVGRFLGSFVMKWVKAEKLLVILVFLGVALLITSMSTSGTAAIATLALCGLANSVMYPNVFALGIAELGPLTSKGSGVITIGNFGGGVIPPLFGFLAERVGIQHALIIPIIGYLFVAYYGFWGYRPKRD
jgi:FHS family L-fucose permease-like MFS transporter